jgi:predicted PurR-regulated permease PerM
MFGGIVGVGRVVLNAVFSALSLLIMTLYFLAALPSIKRQAYRLVPASRRERVTLLSDEVINRIGGFISGALTVAFVAGFTSYLFLLIIGLPYALALALFVALLDLVPLIGATIAAVVVSLLGFTESLVVGISCVVFYIAYQQFENYVVYPRVMRRAVDVPAPVTVVAVLLGGALLGVVGALLAIPVAAAVLLVLRQVAIPRMDQV